MTFYNENMIFFNIIKYPASSQNFLDYLKKSLFFFLQFVLIFGTILSSLKQKLYYVYIFIFHVYLYISCTYVSK